MEHYVTLFNSLFLPQGLALHMSMERCINHYTLWILCVDDSVYDELTTLQLPNVRLLRLADLETKELLRVKRERNIGEYCWTLTPFAPRFVFDEDLTVNRVTYLDADLWFIKNPKAIFDEFENSGKHILITDHAYAPEYDQSVASGKYCVQFMTFVRNESEVVRKWWEDRCIEWCYARFEDGKFGDQKYLDQWPSLFPEHIYEFKSSEKFQAPWNTSITKPSDCVVYHFHGLRIYKDKKVGLVYAFNYKISLPHVKEIYRPYVKDLGVAIKILQNKINCINCIQTKKMSLYTLIINCLVGYVFARSRIIKFKLK